MSKFLCSNSTLLRLTRISSLPLPPLREGMYTSPWYVPTHPPSETHWSPAPTSGGSAGGRKTEEEVRREREVKGSYWITDQFNNKSQFAFNWAPEAAVVYFTYRYFMWIQRYMYHMYLSTQFYMCYWSPGLLEHCCVTGSVVANNTGKHFHFALLTSSTSLKSLWKYLRSASTWSVMSWLPRVMTSMHFWYCLRALIASSKVSRQPLASWRD